MKRQILVALALAGFAVTAQAQTKAEHCDYYARQATANTPTTTGAGRGAMRGAAVGAIGGAIGGNAGAGAAIGAGTGAVVGAVRRNNQKQQSYEYYYDNCMSR